MLLAGVVALLIVLAAVSTAGLVLARRTAQQGLDQVHRAEALLTVANVRRQPSLTLNKALATLQDARSDFQTAQKEEILLSPLLPHLDWVPRFGREAAASPSALAAAQDASSGAIRLLEGLLPLEHALKASASRSAPIRDLLRAVIAGRADFIASCSDLRAATAQEASARSFNATAIASKLATFERQVPRMLVACRALQLVPVFLGASKPFTYLIAYQNPNQLRATGGFIGSAGLVTVRNGSPKQTFTGTWLDDNLSYAPPDPMYTYNREPGWLFRDSNWSPDFPTSAALEQFFLNLDLHRKADAVVNVTPAAAARILAVTGPVYLPEYGRTVDAGNVAQLADYYAHISAYFGPLHAGSVDTERKQFISIVGNHLFTRLRALSLDRLVSLGQSIGESFASGDLQAFFPDRSQENLLRSAGATGGIEHTAGDYLYVVDSNFSYNKINPYVRESVSYRVTVQSNRWLQSEVTLTYTNTPLPAHVTAAGYGPGAGALGGPTDYADFIRLYVPPGAQIETQSGWEPWTPGPAYGKTMLSGYLIVPHDQTRVVHVRYLVPPNVFSWSAGSRYRLTVQHQPGSHLEVLAIRVLADGRSRSYVVPHPRQQNWSTALPVVKRSFSPLPLPAVVPVVVKPGHWIEPHAFLGKIR